MLPASRRTLVDAPTSSRGVAAGRCQCACQVPWHRGASLCTKAASVAHPALFASNSILPERQSLPLPAAVTAAVSAVTSSIDELGTNHRQQQQQRQQQRVRQRQRLFGQNGSSSSNDSSGSQQQQQQQDCDGSEMAALSQQISDRIASSLSASTSYDLPDQDLDLQPSPAAAAAASSSRIRRARLSAYEQQLQQQPQQQQAVQAIPPRSQQSVSWYRDQANRHLTWHIKNAQDIAALRQLMRQYDGSMNQIHVNALFGRLVKLIASRQLRPLEMLSLNSFIPQVLQLVAAAVPDYDERCISNTLHGLAVLELYQERELLASLLTAAERVSLSSFKPQGLANTAWALATLHLNPGPRLTQQLLTASHNVITQFKPLELAQLGWAYGALRIRVSEQWARSWRAAVGRGLPRFSPQGISMVLWGAVRMWEVQQTLQPAAQFVPQQYNSSSTEPADGTAAEHAEWLQAVEEAMKGHMQQYTPHSLSICLWGLARLGYKPSRGFTYDALSVIQPQLSSAAKAADLAVLLYSLAAIGFLPGREWLAAHGVALKRVCQKLSVRQVSNVLWAHGRLGVGPTDGRVLQKLLDQMYHGMQGANARDLANSLWGLAAVGARPEKRWMSIFGAQAESQIHNFSPQEIANLLWAYASLNHKAPHMLLVALWEGVGIGALGSSSGSVTGHATNVTSGITTARLSAFKPQELSVLVWALAKLRAVPGKEWWEQFLQASFHKMKQQSPQGLSNIIWALTELDLQPPPAWLYHWAAATRSSLSHMRPVDLGQVASALQSPVLEPLQLPKLESLLLDVLDKLASVELQSGAYSRVAVEMLMKMTAEEASTDSISSSSSSDSVRHGSSNGSEVLEEVIRQELNGHSRLAVASNGDGPSNSVCNGSVRLEAVDFDVQQLKQVLAEQVLTPRYRRPAAASA